MRRLIVGGAEVPGTRVPFVARLYRDGVGMCGGSLVGARAVLTAAHCVQTDAPSSLRVALARTHEALDRADAPSVVVDVDAVHVHPDYDPERVYENGHDVAVLVLATAVDLPTVSLDGGVHWPDDDDRHDPTSFVFGHGSAQLGGAQSQVLRAARLHLHGRGVCGSRWGLRDLAASSGCASLEGADACSGDSGGPLVIAERGAFVHVGIVSWGYTECGHGAGVYARTAQTLDFVRTHVPDARVSLDVTSPLECTGCATADACTSEGFDVGGRCGCAVHTDASNDDAAFCYVNAACTGATASHAFPGAWWAACERGVLLLPPSAPPAAPDGAALVGLWIPSLVLALAICGLGGVVSVWIVRCMVRREP